MVNLKEIWRDLHSETSRGFRSMKATKKAKPRDSGLPMATKKAKPRATCWATCSETWKDWQRDSETGF